MTKLVKFFPTTEEVQDIVLWVDDIEAQVKEMGLEETMGNIMDRAIDGDLKCSGYIHVIDDNKELAKNMAYVLDANYQKEMELMKEANIAKEMVNEAIEAELKKGIVDPTADDEKAAAARAFLDANGPAIVNAKKAPVTQEEETTTEEETVVEETKKVTGRRRVQGAKPTVTGTQKEAAAKQNQTKEEEVVNVEKKETKVAGGRRRVSSNGSSSAAKKASAGGRKKLGRNENLRGKGFVKHEGPWYLNKSLYTVLDRFESIVDNMAAGEYVDVELGIEAIHMVDPEEITRYQNRDDILVVVQIKSNGTVLEFPIKESTSSNSVSDLTSTSIGWVEYKEKRYPTFGFWRPNAMEVKMKCSCGNEFTANTGNVYCWKCKTRHEDVLVEMESNLDFAGDIDGWVFQTIPNVVVPRDVLALVMALAQYDADLDMYGVIEE